MANLTHFMISLKHIVSRITSTYIIISQCLPSGALAVVDLLIQGGANCCANPAHPALVLAAALAQLRTVMYLLDIGQAPNQQDDQVC